MKLKNIFLAIRNHDESISIESEHDRSVVLKRVSKNKRRPNANIIKNKQLINAKLDMIAEPDSFFKKTSPSTVDQLFQKVLPSKDYALQLGSSSSSSASMYLDSSDHNLDGSIDVILNADSVDFPLKDLEPLTRDVLRPKLTGYKISNSPAEHIW